MFALALLAVTAFGAPNFYTQQETIDRVTSNGAAERSYLVIFNEKAPLFGFRAFDKLKAWLPSVMPLVKVDNVQQVYNIGDDFRGFAVWADSLALKSIMNYDGVRYVEEDQVIRALEFTDRPDWGQIRVNQQAVRDLNTNNAAYAYTGTNYPNAGLSDSIWNWTQSVWQNYRLINNGANAKVWIVDTGVQQNHSEFSDNGRSRVSTSEDVITPGGTATDCHGHGTHCAGTAAGRFRGVAIAADIGNVRVLNCQGSGTTAQVVAGFNFVANNQDHSKHANILSASLGGGASLASDEAINGAARVGVVPVVAAGNNNLDACNYSPARAQEALTVGATNSSDGRSSFSNFGTCVDVFAPGNNLHSAWIGQNAVTYSTISGTSMATPLVSGSIALYATLHGSHVDVTNAKQAIRRTATKGIVVNVGPGSPNEFINNDWN